MNALVLAITEAALHAAPHGMREALLGDLLEEHAARLHVPRADLWLLGEVLRSVVPLGLCRMRRAGPPRVLLAGGAAVAVASVVHALGSAAWHEVLRQVPLRAFHDAPWAWGFTMFLLEVGAALLGAALVVKSRVASRGGRR